MQLIQTLTLQRREAFGTELESLLGELRPREEWLLIFQGFLDTIQDNPATKQLSTSRKRKF